MQQPVISTPNFSSATLVPNSVEVTNSQAGSTTIRCSILTDDGKNVPITRVVPSLHEGSSATWEIDGRACDRRAIVGLEHLEKLLRPYLNHTS